MRGLCPLHFLARWTCALNQSAFESKVDAFGLSARAMLPIVLNGTSTPEEIEHTRQSFTGITDLYYLFMRLLH